MHKINVAAYIRLSKEDSKYKESESIKNQRQLINDFLNKQHLQLKEEYIDDGYSGTTFDRPGFNRLIKDIKEKKINCVITKDLSRLGRDYIQCGAYIENFFPQQKVRYISILDNIDTFNNDINNDILPFKAVFNDLVSKDTSKKIRSILRNKKEQGLFLGSSTSFGYKKSTKDKHKLIIDKKVAWIVKEIFTLALKGNSNNDIARILNERKIITPSLYKKNKVNYHIKNNLWTASSVNNILKNPIYTGDLLQNKQSKLSYKSKKRIILDQNLWIKIENTHKPIISKEIFKLVNTSQNKALKKRLTKLLLENLLFCKECGCHIGVNYNKKTNTYFLMCNNYKRNYKLNLCTSHYMNYQKLEAIVIDSVIKLINDNININNIINHINASTFKNQKQDILNKQETLDRFLKKLYLDKYNNIIDEGTYLQLKEDVLKEKEKYTQTNLVPVINKEFIEKIIVNIPRELLFILIDKIYISKDKQIEIIYKI